MTHDRTQPPPDGLMGRVVAKWKGWESAVLHMEAGSFGICAGLFYRVSYHHKPSQSCRDSRTDTDAALELMGYMESHDLARFRSDVYETTIEGEPSGPCWEVVMGPYVVMIPISGQPMRTAVCWLAVDVLLGVGDE